MQENPKTGRGSAFQRRLAGVALVLGLSTPCTALGQSALWLPQNATSGTIYYNNGPVGVGTSAPLGMLDVRGAPSPLIGAVLNLVGYDYRGGTDALVKIQNVASWTNTLLYMRQFATDSNADVIRVDDASGTQRLAVKQSGKVGIGTGSPNIAAGLTIDSSSGGLYVKQTESWINFNATGNNYFGGITYFRNGTGTPSAQISGSGAQPTYFAAAGNGKVGIGTTTPTAPLTVRSSSLLADTDNTMTLIPSSGSMSHVHWGTTGDWYIRSANSTDGWVVLQDGTGKVLIGTTSPAPNSKLTVKGNITAGDVTVNSAWADYVFEEGYHLMPLQQVGAYIEQNGRLPGVPSATEVAAKGVSVSQTQVKLLEKVEELTLYALAMEKENARLRQELTQQKQAVAEQMQSLEQRLAKLEQD